jgi:hypothetical protein
MQLDSLEQREGKSEYLHTPFVTAGDRLYMVGHQSGNFPDLGWHIPGEMGGIWDHPVKLMDGFSLAIVENNKTFCLDSATRFVNFPVANEHIYELPGENLEVHRVQFVPDGTEGAVVEYVFHNRSPEERNLLLNFKGMIDLTPTWLADRLQVVDANDTAWWDDEINAAVAKDEQHDWFTIFGSNEETIWLNNVDAGCPAIRKGKGVDAFIQTQLVIGANSSASLRYYISGSFQSRQKANAAFQTIKENADQLLRDKINRFNKIKSTATISIPDKHVEAMYTWVKYNTDWLVRDVAGIGRGLSAGLPDYPWWFGADNAYALQGLLATGRHDEVKLTLDLIFRLSEKENGNGRVIHEASTNGAVYNPGNLNETPHFAYLIWKTYEWTGDKSLLQKYYSFVKKGMAWTESQDKDKNGYPDGAGMMEIPGLHSEMIDVVVYTQQGYQAAARMASEMNDAESAVHYQVKANALKEKINKEWWNEEFASFADFKATQPQALELVDQAIIRADTLNKPWAVTELKQTKSRIAQSPSGSTNNYVVHHNWVVNTPMEMKVADADKAQRALKTARNYSNRFGMYVTGIDRDESKEQGEKWKSFSYVGAVMTLPTGVQAIAECNYGNPDQALEYLSKLSNSFGYALPGSIYEVNPDYGMFVQAWTIYSVAVPIVNHFFGVTPAAFKKEIVIQPDMPSNWDEVSLVSLPVGENSIDIIKKRVDETVTYEVNQTNPDWIIKLKIKKEGVRELKVNGSAIEQVEMDGVLQIELKGNSNKIEISHEGA